MTKIDLSNVSTLTGINSNFQAIASELNDKVLYRAVPTGEPNTMQNPLDMNSQHIYNLPEPIDLNEAARLQDVVNALNGANFANLVQFTPYNYVTANTVQGAIQQVVDKTNAIVSDYTFTINQVYANFANTVDPTKGDALVGVKQPFTGSVARTQQQYNAAKVQWQDFCVGDGVNDETTNVQNYLNAVGTHGTADFTGGTFKVFGVKTLLGQVITNGTFTLAQSGNVFNFCFVPAKNTRFINVDGVGPNVTGTAATAKYTGFIYAGNTTAPAPFNTAPANGVQVISCNLTLFTANIMIAGATADATPVKWKIVDNDIDTTVGFAGQSEGYGILLSPCSRSLVQGNTVTNTQRHGIYLAGESSRNVVHGNNISTVDNVAIQSNTYTSQNYAFENIISNNTINGVTKNGGYSYNSSVGIGVYGKHSRCKVIGNIISGFIDIGIDVVGISGDTTRNGVEAFISDNTIDCGSNVAVAAIEIGDMGGAVVQGNKITMSNVSAYGILVNGVTGFSSNPIVIKNNDLNTSGSNTAFRTAWTGQRVVIRNNTLTGFPISGTNSIIFDTGGNTVIDEFQSTAFYGTDADFTHNTYGPDKIKDSRTIRWAANNTVTRTITLAERGWIVPGMEFTVVRTVGTGTLNVVTASTPGSPLKAIAVNQWATFVVNQGLQWEIKGFGST